LLNEDSVRRVNRQIYNDGRRRKFEFTCYSHAGTGLCACARNGIILNGSPWRGRKSALLAYVVEETISVYSAIEDQSQYG
jgi:hypothetical protein